MCPPCPHKKQVCRVAVAGGRAFVPSGRAREQLGLSLRRQSDSEITSVLDDWELENLLNFEWIVPAEEQPKPGASDLAGTLPPSYPDLPLESIVQSECFPMTRQTTGQSAHSAHHPAVIAGPPQQRPPQEGPQQQPPQEGPQQQPPQQERPQQQRP